MAKGSGTRLKIMSDGVVISNLTQATLSTSAGMIDVTTKDSNAWSEFLPGLKKATISGSGIVDFSASFPPSTIFTKLSAGTSCSVIFYDTVTGEKSYSATGYYSKFDLKGGVEDNATFDFDIQLTATVTQTATT